MPRNPREGLILIALLLCGCGSPALMHSPGAVMIRTELYFGLSRPNGPDVTEAEFEAFMEEVVAPRFPAGHTVLNAQGRWREETGKSRREGTKVLVILHASGVEANRKIEEIRASYKTRFAQEAVMRVDDEEKVAF